MQGNYAIFVRAKDGSLINRITDFVSLHILMTLNDPGEWTVTSLSRERCPFAPGTGIVVVRNGAFLYGGVVTEIQDDLDALTGLHNWTVIGKGDLEYLNRRFCYVDPSSSSPTAAAHYTDSGYLSAVIRNLIFKNLGPGALTARQEPVVMDYQQEGAGPSVSVSLRFQNLFKAVTALVSGNGWNIRPCWDADENKIYFEIFQGRDLTGAIVFTEQLSNITGAEYLASVPQGNYILAGGTGELTSRQFDTAQDDDSISEWGRVEFFQDARNQNNLSGYADEVLTDKDADTIGYSCTASTMDLAPQFGTDFVLGDFVGMKVFGQYITAEVQQCEINVEDGIESVEPRFGTVAIGKLRNIFRQIRDLRADVNELLGTEIA